MCIPTNNNCALVTLIHSGQSWTNPNISCLLQQTPGDCQVSSSGTTVHSKLYVVLILVFNNHASYKCDDYSVVVNKDEDTPLFLECSNGHLDWVKALINEHIDPRGK